MSKGVKAEDQGGAAPCNGRAGTGPGCARALAALVAVASIADAQSFGQQVLYLQSSTCEITDCNDHIRERLF